MNERIKELSLQATDSIPDDVSAEHAMYLFQAKFAELIVKECVELLYERRKPIHTDTSYGQGWVDGRLSGADLIKEHFGVEE